MRRYLDVLESVLKKNGYEEEEDWLLALNNSVLGTRLEATLEGLHSHAEAKTELLAEFRQTQDAMWRNLLSCKQGSAETFFRYSS